MLIYKGICNNEKKFIEMQALVTKNSKSAKPLLKEAKQEVLTVSEYSKQFGLTEQIVRTRLKKGALQATEIIKNGKSVLGIKLDSPVAASGSPAPEQDKQDGKKSPKLIKVGSLKQANFQDIIQEKDDEIKKLKSELRDSFNQAEKLDKEVKRLNEIIKSKSDLIQTHEKTLKAKDKAIQELTNLDKNKQQIEETAAKQSVKIPFNPPIKEESKKDSGFFAKLFGRK